MDDSRHPRDVAPSPRLTIAQCIHDLTQAGAQQVVAHLVSLADRDRFRMIVYAFKGGAICDQLRIAGHDVHILPQRIAYLDPSLVMRLAECFRRDQVDIVHTHLFGADLHGLLAAQLSGPIPAITTIHIDRHDGWRQRLFAGCILRRFRHIVAVGQAVADYLISTWPALTGQVTVIANGVSEPSGVSALRGRSRALLKLSDEDLVVGTMGRLHIQKGHDDLLRAFQIVSKSEPRAKLVILGEGPLRGRLESARLAANLGERILMPGNLPQASEVVPGFDLFVLSSLWEGLPMALLEAMAAGLPCISTDVGSVGQVLIEGTTGLLVPPGQPESLATAILGLLANPQAASALGRAARVLVRDQYAAPTMVSGYERLYLSLFRSSALPPGVRGVESGVDAHGSERNDQRNFYPIIVSEDSSSLVV